MCLSFVDNTELPSCEETRCDNYEQCVMIEGAPNCICLPGFEDTEQGCYPVSQRGKTRSLRSPRSPLFDINRAIVTAPCDVEDNCSPNGFCNLDAEKQKYICICLPGFIGECSIRLNRDAERFSKRTNLIRRYNSGEIFVRCHQEPSSHSISSNPLNSSPRYII